MATADCTYLLVIDARVGACDASSRIERESLGCGRIYVCMYCMYPYSRLYAHHDDQQPTATRHICERWHMRGVLMATVPVVASVGAYDASSRINRQSLGCGRMYLCMYPCMLFLIPALAHHNDQNDQLPPDKTTHPPAAAGTQQQQQAKSCA